VLFVSVSVAPTSPPPAAASTPPAALQQMLDCRQLGDAAARLACFDRSSSLIASGVASRDLVVIDRERAQVAGRSLFGFSVPNFGGLFGSGSDVAQIESTVAAASHNAYGSQLIHLTDGSAWSQTDDSVLGLNPRVGDKVVVRRGALGSFVLSVNRQPGFKAKRVE
jgi:hypothetical protein